MAWVASARPGTAPATTPGHTWYCVLVPGSSSEPHALSASSARSPQRFIMNVLQKGGPSRRERGQGTPVRGGPDPESASHSDLTTDRGLLEASEVRRCTAILFAG